MCASAAPQETVLYSFETVGGGFPDGDLVVEKSGALIGTASGSGSDASPFGRNFQLRPSKNGWKFHTLLSFDGQDGATPMRGLTAGAAGSFYGTTTAGGSANRGTCSN